jgi:hypothetical protein
VEGCRIRDELIFQLSMKFGNFLSNPHDFDGTSFRNASITPIEASSEGDRSLL